MSDGSAPAIGVTELLKFLSPNGQRQIAEFIERAKRERGSGWLTELKGEYPTFCWLATLVAEHDADTAVESLAEEFPNYPISLIRSQLIAMHAWLRHEIEKPR